MLRSHLILFLFILMYTTAFGQGIECQLKVSVADQKLDTLEGNSIGDTLLYVEKLQFYLHASENGKSNAENSILLGIRHPSKLMKAKSPFQLYLGVDSVLNYNGVHEGSLDPINGMYWAWQTGYIHCKMEGNIVCDSIKQRFEYHIGGYSTKNSGPFFIGHKNNEQNLQVVLDIHPAIHWAMNKGLFRIMSPGKQSDEMAKAILSGISVR